MINFLTKPKNKIVYLLNIILSLVITTSAYADTKPKTIATSELQAYSSYPASVQKLINSALTLTKRKLNYQYGSADPKNGGMDCSGTIYYLLQSFNVKDIPRQSDLIYEWVVKVGNFHAVKTQAFSSNDFAKLKPGDLLFWTGTYPVKRKTGVSHVMIYLGKNKQGERLMFGASNGRTYQGQQIWGVSVFDFHLPAPNSKSRFIGYSCIPSLTCK